jgi:hypothetical protein
MTQENKPDALAVHQLPEDLVRTTGKIEEIVARSNPAAIARLPPMTQTIVLAKGMHELRLAMTDDLVKRVFMPLQGTRLGFRTDKDKDGGYPHEIVRDAIIEAMMRGLRPIGNELNIIGGNCYTTLEGLERKVREFPGLASIELTPGVPTMKDGGALVPFEARWRINGTDDCLVCALRTDADGVVHDTRIPVRVNSGQIVDAILGKAKRKMLARVYERLTGFREPDGDAIDTEGEVVAEAVAQDKSAQGAQGAAESLAAKHRAKRAAGKADKPAEPPADPAAGSDGHPEPGADG